MGSPLDEKIVPFLFALIETGKVGRAAHAVGVHVSTAWNWIKLSRRGDPRFASIDLDGVIASLAMHVDLIMIDAPSNALVAARAARARKRAERREHVEQVEVRVYAPAPAGPSRDPVSVAREREAQLVEAYRSAPRSNWTPTRSFDREAASEGIGAGHVPEGGACIAADRPTPKRSAAAVRRELGLGPSTHRGPPVKMV